MFTDNWNISNFSINTYNVWFSWKCVSLKSIWKWYASKPTAQLIFSQLLCIFFFELKLRFKFTAAKRFGIVRHRAVFFIPYLLSTHTHTHTHGSIVFPSFVIGFIFVLFFFHAPFFFSSSNRMVTYVAGWFLISSSFFRLIFRPLVFPCAFPLEIWSMCVRTQVIKIAWFVGMRT